MVDVDHACASPAGSWPAPSSTPRRCTPLHGGPGAAGRAEPRMPNPPGDPSPSLHPLFPEPGSVRSVHPDGFGVLRAYGRTYPFFLEWERRALHPSTIAARLGPYLRYCSTNQPLDDHGHRPPVLVVFDDYLAEGDFLGVARREMERAGVGVPLWSSHTGLLEKVGPLEKAWRSPEVLEPSCPFR